VITINNIEDLNRLEARMEFVIRRYKLEEVLFGLRRVSKNFEPFVIGGAALFAIRFCTEGQKTRHASVITKDALEFWLRLVMAYLLADPLGYDKTLQREYKNSNPVFTFLRIFGNQLPYHVSPFGHHAQPLILYHDIPRELEKQTYPPKFRFEKSFRDLYGASASEFVNIGFTAYVAALSKEGFTLGAILRKLVIRALSFRVNVNCF